DLKHDPEEWEPVFGTDHAQTSAGEGPIAMMTGGLTTRHVGRANALRAAVVGLLALTPPACSGGGLATLGSPSSPTARAPQRQAELPAGQEREHMRILAAYGGPYEDQGLQALLDRTVD